MGSLKYLERTVSVSRDMLSDSSDGEGSKIDSQALGYRSSINSKDGDIDYNS